MAKKCARTFSIVVEKGKKSILDVTHLLPDALPRSVWRPEPRIRWRRRLTRWWLGSTRTATRCLLYTSDAADE